MSNVGYSTTPTYGFYKSAAHTGMQAAALATMPTPGGLITSISCYAGTYSGSSASGYLCLWDISFNLLASVAVTIPGSLAWVSGTLATPYFIASGTQFYIGYHVSGTAGYNAEYDSVGGATMILAWDNAVPGSLTNRTTYSNNQLGAYATYTPAEGWVNTGTSGSPNWVSGAVYINTGTSASPVWTAAENVVNTGTSGSPTWTDGA